ncbi:hypothetical protein [Shewanella halifaxensis]|uniref:hypothetical protein n=1 Tax=Shewanella halifaxensis TaxID=271098 RepID=UPI000D598DF9|nr:hypothetical protein [Shewanella halifaxensis]
MNEYYLAIKTTASPLYDLMDWDDIINYPWNVYPNQPLRTYSSFRPEGKYTIGEYFSVPAVAFSKRIVEEAGLRHIYGVNLVPTIVEDRKQQYEFYYLNLMVNKISCMDKQLSKYRWDDEYQEVNAIKSLVLDDNKLKKIPLQKRLIFVMAEDDITLYHQTIVDRIMATKPVGLNFVSPDAFRFGMS